MRAELFTQYSQWILLIIAGYILGSCLFCEWLPKLIFNKDISRDSDDGCPGAANVFKLCGWKLGIPCLLLDMAKGFAPVFIAYKRLGTGNILFALVMIAPVLGHACSVFYHFQGGKCIAVAFGVLIAILPVTPEGWILAALYIFFSTVVKISPNSRRSITVFILFTVTAFTVEMLASRYSICAGCIFISAAAIIKHLFPVKRAISYENTEKTAAKLDSHTEQ